jgi:long-chain acyl-CoA synthetase
VAKVRTITGTSDPSVYPTPATSVGSLFLDRVATTPDGEAFRQPVGDGWRSTTWEQTRQRCSALAAGLLALGVEPEQRVGLISHTRVEWIHADLAIALSGAATTTVYPSTEAADVAFILGDSGSNYVFAEDDRQVEKLRAHRADLPSVRQVITFDGTPDGDWVISVADLADRGAAALAADPDLIERTVAAIRPDQLATLIYTSGTTGRPTGVELLHSCWTYEGAGVAAIGLFTEADVQLLWLPMSHSFGKVLLAAQLQIGFATAVDGRVDRIVENLAAVQPTLMGGAPRIFEKVYARVEQTARSEGAAKARIYDWAFGVGRKASGYQLQGRSLPPLLAVQHRVADALVFSKIRARLGGKMRYLVSGSAALSKDVASWFHAAGLVILEGYGLTETSAGTCLNRPDNVKFGTVGEPFAGTQIKIAQDGEILVRGPGVMRGYHHLPDQTTEVLDPDGWFATGDIGEIDDAGRVRITDRKKDLVKTSGGKYIAPSLIEAQFKAVCPLASQMLVHADRRNYATALITLDAEALPAWASEHGVTGDYAAMTQDATVHAFVASCVDQLNGTLNRWETIKDFRILPADFDIESGELTPSLKVRRSFVEGKYETVLDSMYGGRSRG